MPNSEYNGQLPTKLVSKKIPAITMIVIPIAPDMTLVKYNIIAVAAKRNLIHLSAEPMFFFIIDYILVVC